MRTILCAAILAIASSLAHAQEVVRISEDRGGQIGDYLETYATIRASGMPVEIDGNCLSACTLFLGLVPADRVCVTSRARLGFHAAWMPDADGRPVTSPRGTHALRSIYPAWTNRWVNRRGGLTPQMIYMEFATLQQHYRVCGEPASLRRKVHRIRSTRLHYASARAR